MLKAAQIKNVFWSNGSVLKPAFLPDEKDEAFKEFPDHIPTMATPYVGWVILKGDFNYAYYDGSYYFLQIIQERDRKKRSFKYALIRDEWSNAVRKGIKVRGTINRTDNTFLLNKYIHYAIPVIEQPAKLNFINLYSGARTLEHINTDGIKDNFTEYRLANFNWDQIENAQKVNDDQIKQEVLLGWVRPMKLPSWKNNVVKYIKDFEASFKAKKYKITRASQLSGDLKNFWTITSSEPNKSLGTTEEGNVTFDLIDLSKLTDIVPKSTINRNLPPPPNKDISYSPISRPIGKEIVFPGPVEIIRDESGRLTTGVKIEGIEPGTILKGQIKGEQEFSWYIYDVDNDNNPYLQEIKEELNKPAWVRYLQKPEAEKAITYLKRIDNAIKYADKWNISDYYDWSKAWLTGLNDADRLRELPKKLGGDYDLDKIYEMFKDIEIHNNYREVRKPIGWVTVAAGMGGGYTSKGTESTYETVATFTLDGRKRFIYGYEYGLYSDNDEDIYALVRRLKNIGNKQLSREIKKEILDRYHSYLNPEYPKGKTFELSEEDLKTGDHLFELSGTSFYLFIRDGTPHLIIRNPNEFLKPKGESFDVKFNDEFPELSIWELINQRPLLQIYNKTIELKDRITKDYRFKVALAPIQTPDKISSYDYIQVIHEGKFDSINEIIEVPKKALSPSAAKDAIQIDNLILQQQRAREDYELRRQEIYKTRKLDEEGWELKWQDLNNRHILNYVNVGTGIITTGAGLIGAAAGGNFGALTALQGVNAASSAFANIAGMGNEIRALQLDERRALLSRVMDVTRLDIAHHRSEFDIKRDLLNMGNVYYDTPTTQTDILEKYQEINKLNHVHLKLWTPTAEQLVIIRHLWDLKGSECLIPDQSLTIDRTLRGYYGFTVITHIETGDEIEFNHLHNNLLNGIRVIENLPEDKEEQIPQITTTSELLNELESYREELRDSYELIDYYRNRELDDVATAKVEDLQAKLKVADERLRNAADAAHAKDEELRRVKAELEACTAAGDKTELLEKVKALETEKQDLETKLNVEGNRYSQIFDQFEAAKRNIQTLTAKKEELDGQLLTQSEQIQQLTTKKEELEGQLLECQNQAAKAPTGAIKDLDGLWECLKKELMYVIYIYYGYFYENIEYYTTSEYGGVAQSRGVTSGESTPALWQEEGYRKVRDLLVQINIRESMLNYPEQNEEQTRQEKERKWEYFETGKTKTIMGGVGYYLYQGKNPWFEDMAKFFNVIRNMKRSMEIGINDFNKSLNEKREKTWIDKLIKRVTKCIQEYSPPPPEVDEEAIRALNQQLTQANNTLAQYRKTLTDKDEEIRTQTNLANLYLREKTTLATDLGKCRRDLDGYECPIPDYAEYVKKYRDLGDDEWDAKFNLGNFWRLKTNEAGKYLMALAACYYQWKTNYNNKAQEYREILRTMVEIIHTKSNNIYAMAGNNWPYYWTTWQQSHLDQAVTRNDEWGQHIRATLPRGTVNIQKEPASTKAVRNALAAYDQYTKGKSTNDWKNEETFKEIGRLSLNLFEKFMQAMNKTVSLWNHYKEANIKRIGKEPLGVKR